MKKGTVAHLENSFIVRHGLKHVRHKHLSPVPPFQSKPSKEFDEVWPNVKMYDFIIIGSISDNTEVPIERIKKQSKSTRVLIFTMSLHYPQALNYLRAGADSYLPQHTGADQIVQVLQNVLSYKRYLCRELLEHMAQETLDIAIQKKKTADNLPATPLAAKKKLSKLQKQILRLLTQEDSVSDISRKLDLQTSTVGMYKSNVYKKLGINPPKQLVQIYYDDLYARLIGV